MEPADSLATTGTQAPHRLLVLPPLLAIVAWQAEPTAERRLELVHALERVAELLGLGVGRLRVNAPPLAELDLDLGGGTTGAKIALRVPGDAQPIGSVRISGDHEQAAALAHALELGFMAARAGARAERATRQLMALDQAVRGISGVLDLDRGVGAAGPPGERGKQSGAEPLMAKEPVHIGAHDEPICARLGP